MWRHAAAAALFFFLCSGCVIFAPEKRPGAPLDMPERYSVRTRAAGDGDSFGGEWWRAFGSEELNRLVSRALSGNFDIETARARLAQAQASARKINAGAMPVLTGEAGAGTSKNRVRASSRAPAKISEQESWSLGMAASYEIDLWGRVRSMRRAGAAGAAAAREDMEAAAMTAAARTVETWIDLIAVRREMATLQKQIQNAQSLLEAQKVRFLNGRARAIEVSGQKEALAAIRSEAPILRLSERRLMTALAFLLGMASPSHLEIAEFDIPEPPPMPPAGVPADLLAGRPDVRAASLRLQSADWEVSAARADLLPSLSLSGRSSFAAAETGLLFDNWLLNLAAGLTGPLFDGGRRGAEADRARAVARERLTAYARTVAEAVKEVEDAMAEEERRRVYAGLLKQRLKAAGETMKEAFLLYRNGAGDYLSYSGALTSFWSLERLVETEKAALAKARVGVFRALGGNWTREPAQWGAESDEQGNGKK
ncbi:conserved exported hypothetical protein [Candidatus Desulfarcum epimagneticum]|uniref:RND transporter n=1 Tax=uncultured Desulfobacteraceae bacterium TaxID=218296 RepID=A0A484HP83_9BACT|nr:conserved exported hypothetical protein [uncultured Desulfobacteraceae bacterium]